MSPRRLYIDDMTQPEPGLDSEARVRIEAEERHREEYRRKLQAESNKQPRKRPGCGTWVLAGFAVLLVAGIAGQMSTPSTSTSATQEVVESASGGTESGPTDVEPAAPAEPQPHRRSPALGH